MSLPHTFQLSFDYNVQVSLKKPGNIIDIYSLSLNSSLLSLYLNPNSNKISVYYLGNLIINKGISIVESASKFNRILVVVDYLSLSISNGVDPAVRALLVPNAVSSERNIFFASNIVAEKGLVSAGGRMKNIQIHGIDLHMWMYVCILVYSFFHSYILFSNISRLYVRTYVFIYTYTDKVYASVCLYVCIWLLVVLNMSLFCKII